MPRVQTQTPPKLQSLYFVNAWVDFALIGGASLITYLAMNHFSPPGRSPGVISLAATLAWIVNWPHFSATNFRLYHSTSNIAQYPMTAIVIPILVLAGVVASLTSPEAIAPFFVKLYSVWSPYHFSGQTLGISLIYARRAGLKIEKPQRTVLSAFIFGTYALLMARGETGTSGFNYFGVSYPSLGLPQWVPDMAAKWLWVTGTLIVLYVARWCYQNRRILPPIVLLPAATQFAWFVVGPSIENFSEFVPLFHSLQYLLIAWSVQLKEKMDEENLRPSWGYVLGESARWGLANIAGGALLFYGLPRFFAHFGYDLNLCTAVIFSAIQIHHFFVDGVIWKLKNSRVLSPLMVDIQQMLGSPSTPARNPI